MDRKQKTSKSSSENNADRNAERNLAELFAAHNLLQSNPLALLQQQMNVMAQQAGPAAFFTNPNSNPYNNPAATWLYLDYLSRIQAAQQMIPGLNEQQQQQQQPQTQQRSSTSAAAVAGSSGSNPSSSSSSSRPVKQSRQPANKKIKLPADTDIIRMGSSHQRTTPPRAPPPAQHSTSRKNQPPKESPPNVQLFKIEDLDAPLNLSKKSVAPLPPKHPTTAPLVVKDRETHSKLNNNNVTIIPHAHTKPENLSTPPGRYPQNFVPKPAHMTKSTLYSHVIPKIPQVGMVVKPNEKLVKKKTTVASLLASARVQQESSATSSRSSSPETNNLDIRSSPTSAPHRPWMNNPPPLVIPSVKKPLQHHHQQQERQQSLPPPPPQLTAKQQKQQQQQQQILPPSSSSLSGPTSQQQKHQSLKTIGESTDSTDPNGPPSNTSTPADLAYPLSHGWKRETLLKGLGVQGLSGEVVYISPSGVRCKQLSEVKKHLTSGLGIKMFSFSSRLLIGDFLLPTNSADEQNTTLKLSANQLANWLSSEGEENKKEEIRLKEERERKKQHSVLIRALEMHRRSKRRQKLQNDRKLRKKAELLEQQQASQPVGSGTTIPSIQQPSPLQQQQQQQQQQQTPIDTNADVYEFNAEQSLPDLSRVKGLRLSSQGFANLLQIYEFLHTFGETLGFDMESLPSMSNLQKAFLHVDENEEELLSVMSHLLVCAVEDPGMNNPNKHLTNFGQTLKQADITFGSLSEVLRLFMEGVSDSEPEAELYSEWLNEAPFLALSPTRKSTILAFICDLLLQNKAVLKHLESSTENAHTARKERQQNDIKVRRLRMLCARKTVAAVAAEQQEKLAAELKQPETPTTKSNIGGESDDNTSSSKVNESVPADAKDSDSKDNKEVDSKENSDKDAPTTDNTDNSKENQDNNQEETIITTTTTNTTTTTKEEDSVPPVNSTPESISNPSSCSSTPAPTPLSLLQPPLSVTPTPSSSLPPPSLPPTPAVVPDEPEDSEDQLEESESDADAKLSVDEIRMKMNQLNNMSEKLKKQMIENFKIIRSSCLGQDRWRRRYWNLPNSGGIYVEGGSSAEFQELVTQVEELFKDATISLTNKKQVKEENDKEEEAEEKPSSPEPSESPINEKQEIKVEKMEVDEEKLNENVENEKVETVEKEGEAENTTTSAVTPKNKAENDKSELEKSTNSTQFEVPPPVIKIFSFTPRTGCSGKVVQVVEPVEEPESDDQVFLKNLKDNRDVWDGWWKISEDTKNEFLEKLCSKGVREKNLVTNLQNILIAEGEELDDDDIPLNVQSPEQGWDPELCYKVHLQLLETLETLEERVASASLQVKGWQIPNRKNDSLSEPEIIEMVKTRLLDLESAIERRYLKPPLGKSVNDLNLSNLTELTTDTNKDQSHGSRALTNWRDGITRSKTPGVLSMAIYTLDSSIAWDKSVMKASCQLCKGGDNEDKLLLCDACDRGYHTYCFKPVMEQIPDGDWFCWECINKATGVKGCIVCGKQSGGGKILSCDKCVKAYHLDCLSPPLAKAPRGRWHCADHRKLSPNRKRKSENSDKTPDGVPKQKTNNKKAKTEANWCANLLEDLASHEDAWPFLDPVNTRQFPTYKKVIKNPMDLATIRSRLPTYKTRENFLQDVRLIFDNCETFNEDDSPVGKAGHQLRIFFESKLNCK